MTLDVIAKGNAEEREADDYSCNVQSLSVYERK
jgi:hypothetical protein